MAAAGSNPVFADTEQSLVRRNGVLAHRQPGLGLTTPAQGMCLMNVYSVLKIPREKRPPQVVASENPLFVQDFRNFFKNLFS